jgi:hypothetical protein
MPELQWQILNKKFGQKFALSVLFLDLNFFKNLGFSQSEHCELGTRRLSPPALHWFENLFLKVLHLAACLSLSLNKVS